MQVTGTCHMRTTDTIENRCIGLSSTNLQTKRSETSQIASIVSMFCTNLKPRPKAPEKIYFPPSNSHICAEHYSPTFKFRHFERAAKILLHKPTGPFHSTP